MQTQQIDTLLNFLATSPTPFHAVSNMAACFEAGGFERLLEANDWQLKKGGKYFVTRNNSSIVAFVVGKSDPLDTGIAMTGAHTDSPCLKVKPEPVLNKKHYMQLGVEVYGGALLNPWFDRDLGLAGRVDFKNTKGELDCALVDFDKAVGVIPSLAIHLDREANEKRAVNKQKDLPVVLMHQQSDFNFYSLLFQQVKKKKRSAKQVMGYDLSFYDRQEPAIVGLNDEFVASARLDNLLSCFVGMQALLASKGNGSRLLVCNDHEEVGSASAVGAQGPMLKTVLERWLLDTQQRARVIDRSAMISMDNAHGIHPNFSERHDNNHGPVLNEGPVIKVNANQRYASSSETVAVFRKLCADKKVPVQSFVVRSDMACGSTIGPITATELGVKTVDVGVPQFAMHSIRETCGVKDFEFLLKVIQHFYST